MPKPQHYSKAIMDYFPWPDGLGFQNAEDWWSYIISQTEEDRLELLIMAALLDQGLCLLLLRHDRILLNRFSFSEEIVMLLCEIEVTTLAEFVQELLKRRSFDG